MDAICSQRPVRDAWFTLGLRDEATFEVILANSAVHFDGMHRGGREPPAESETSMHYQTLAISKIRQQLNEVSYVTDEMIGCVTGLLCYDVGDHITHTDRN